MTAYLLFGVFKNLIVYVVSKKEYFRSVVHPSEFLLTDVNHVAHTWETFALHMSAAESFQLREHIVCHLDEIAVLFAVYDTKSVHVRVLAEIFQLSLFVVGINSDCHCTNLGTGIEESQPVRHISCPNTYVSSFFHSDGKQTFRHIVHTFVELAPCEAQVAVGINYIFFVWGDFGPMFEPVAKCSF